MLKVENISKSYKTGDFEQQVLNNVSIAFRKTEFVAVLGQSGSGKTTFLNIIGGLDKYDSGDLIINGKSTKQFKDSDWDAYRNNSVGFVFQSYNLITHLSLLDNVELGMTLSGVSSHERHKRALESLEKVGLKDHIHKKPNQLSGGQMQRVAIARALANNPDIIMMDEPTGALDTSTSIQIMELIKEISKDKLVIMVTHNPELADQYADRIIRFSDGKVTDDTNPYTTSEENADFKFKRTKMSYLTALKISGKNISTKMWRTLLTAFASSIGIIGIALILSLSTGFRIQIDEFQSDTMKNMPIIIGQQSMTIDNETIEQMNNEMASTMGGDKEYTDEQKVFLYNSEDNKILHSNTFTDEYLEYIKNVDPEICKNIGFTRLTGMNLIRKVDGSTIPVSLAIGANTTNMSEGMTNMSGSGLTSYPIKTSDDGESYLEENYELLAGSYPQSENDLILVVNNQNRLDCSVLQNLGFDVADDAELEFTDIVGTEFQLVSNNDYYIKTQFGTYMPNSEYNKLWDLENNITLKISGIVRLKEDVTVGLIGTGVAYSDNLVETIIEKEKDSDIVKAQIESDLNVITNEAIDEQTKKMFITSLGGDSTPFMIYMYTSNFEDKDMLLEYLDEYNEDKDEKDMVMYTDMAETMSSMTQGIMDAITMVLIAFASISLVVSLIMIGIITYISVLERTKEIGILRALGARKRDIANVFNAETFIIGASSGLLGIIIAYTLTFPINAIVEDITSIPNVAVLNPLYAVILITISVVLTLAGGAIPAKIAANKNPVESLRNE